ncbi:sensor histidine kinase [Candidatus Accumulibacter contiguus]|nr:sensor histidine kinase [Candidatus Accumulibacter contiguus]
MTSLKGSVALWLLPPLILLLAANAVLSYRGAREAADLAYDRSLHMALMFLGERLTTSEEVAATGDLPRSIREVLGESAGGEGAGADGERVFFAVIASDGRSLAGENDLPKPKPNADGTIRFADARYRGKAVRVASIDIRSKHLTAVDGAGLLLEVVLVEDAGARVALAQQVFYADLRRQLALAVFSVALAWLGLAATLRSLRRLSEDLARREAEDLAPLATDDMPTEVHPLIEAINRHLARLADLLETSRRFAADVAHQLRTPLTLLGAQAQYGLRQKDTEEMRRIIEGIVAASRSAQRLCNQMLSLSRIEAAKGLMNGGVRLDLAALLRETALDLGVLALEKHIDLTYTDTGRAVPVIGNEVMLRELFSNLIDNALRYTPYGGRVGIAADIEGEMARVTITDTGPGIAPAARVTLFNRFHRRFDRSGAEGSGLGLAIVRQICLAHGGMVELGNGTEGQGLSVNVRLPVSSDPAAGQ